MYIWEQADWPKLTWQDGSIAAPLAAVRPDQGRLIGRMEALGFMSISYVGEQTNLKVRMFQGSSSKAIGFWKLSDECWLTGLQDPSMYLATAFSTCWRGCQATGQISSDFMVLKNVLTIELS